MIVDFDLSIFMVRLWRCWPQHQADISENLKANAKRVVFSSTAKDDPHTVVMGVIQKIVKSLIAVVP